jgi:PLP dependent protein
MPIDEDVRTRLRFVEASIARAAHDCGRDPAEIGLVAVTKTHDAAAIEPALAAGHRRFGENRVQEAAAKWPALRARWPDVELHLIGSLQSNKARQAVALFDVIHTLDRPGLARELAREVDRQGKRPRLLVQVNTGAEPQKGGVPPEEADTFLASCRDEYGVSVDGLMCIPPADALAAPHFALLATIARRNALRELSMGMSGDYMIAIELGATLVRVGSAIFGERAATPVAVSGG